MMNQTTALEIAKECGVQIELDRITGQPHGVFFLPAEFDMFVQRFEQYVMDEARRNGLFDRRTFKG
jgi:hypothetical protein